MKKRISPNHTSRSLVGHRDFQSSAVSTGKNSDSNQDRQWKCFSFTILLSPESAGVMICLKAAPPGVGVTTCIPETGWSNSDIFRGLLRGPFS